MLCINNNLIFFQVIQFAKYLTFNLIFCRPNISIQFPFTNKYHVRSFQFFMGLNKSLKRRLDAPFPFLTFSNRIKFLIAVYPDKEGMILCQIILLIHPKIIFSIQKCVIIYFVNDNLCNCSRHIHLRQSCKLKIKFKQ